MGIRSKMNACVLAVAMLGAPLAASAAGFGKMTVLSNLGQPLSAEIDLVSVSPEEAETLAVRLAPPDAFQERGVDYSAYIRSLRFQLSKRPSGQYFIRVNSTQAVNEPFVDFLVEMSWASGRIVRQYTDVLDPPDYAPANGSKSVVVNTPQTTEASAVRGRKVPAAETLPADTEKRSAVRQKRARKPAAARPAAPADTPAPAEAADADTHRVRSGETLGQIAARYKPTGVSLDQMLYGLYKNNNDAFLNQNINRLKSGAILRIPDKQEVSAVTPQQAAQEIRAHASDWNAYKQNVAAAVEKAPVKAAAPQASATGKLTAKAEDKATPPAAGPRDVVKLSKGDTAGANAAAQQRIRNLEEESVARERALKEANERVAMLEKSVSDMQRLLELKSKAAADLQKQADKNKAANVSGTVKPAATPAPAPAAKPATPPKPVVASAPVAAPVKPAPAVKAASAPTAKPAASAVAAKPAPASAAVASPAKASAVAASPAKAVASAPAASAHAASLAPAKPVKPKSAPIQIEEPPQEESFLSGNGPMLLGGLLGLGVLGSALFYFMRRRRSRPSFEDSVLTGGDLKSNTVLGSVGASIVDTSSTTDNSFFTDFSREGLGTIDTDEVDPVAEAEVYMAYGRDAQAEEILKDALIKDGSRQEVRLKLMEIYASRRNLANFELYATELHTATNGAGPLWARASAMGRELDPGNALYQEAAAGVEEEASLASLVTDPAEESVAADTSEVDLDFEIGTVKMQAVPPAAPAAAEPAPVAEDSASVDFDLGAAEQAEAEPEPSAGLDFDFGSAPAPVPMSEVAEAEKTESTPILDFHFDLGDVGASAPAEETVRMSAVNTAAPAVETPEQPAAPAAEETTTIGGEVPLNFSFGDLDLNLDKAEDAPAIESFEAVEIAVPSTDEPAESLGFNLDDLDATAMNAVEDPIETKLDLAKAYIEMGDSEGAREILNEAVSEGNEEQRQRAERLLEQI